jgi:hypothetical protein
VLLKNFTEPSTAQEADRRGGSRRDPAAAIRPSALRSRPWACREDVNRRPADAGPNGRCWMKDIYRAYWVTHGNKAVNGCQNPHIIKMAEEVVDACVVALRGLEGFL